MNEAQAFYDLLTTIESGIMWLNLWAFIAMLCLLAIDRRIYKANKRTAQHQERLEALLEKSATPEKRIRIQKPG